MYWNGNRVSLFSLTFLIIISLFLQFSTVHAASGKAKITHFGYAGGTADDYTGPYIYITNIKDVTVTVSIRFFDREGDLIVDTDNLPGTGTFRAHPASMPQNWNDLGPDDSVTFDLEAGKTITVFMRHYIGFFNGGHGRIKWNADATINKALRATLVVHWYHFSPGHSSWVGSYPIQINGGESF